MLTSRSLTNTKKRMGPTMKPSWTPDNPGAGSEQTLPTTTDCVCPDSQAVIH